MKTKNLLVHELNMSHVLFLLQNREKDTDKILKSIPPDIEQIGTFIENGQVTIKLQSKKFKDEKDIKIKELLEVDVVEFTEGMEDGKDCTEPVTKYIIPMAEAKEKGIAIDLNKIHPYIMMNNAKWYIKKGDVIITSLSGMKTILSKEQYSKRFR